MIFADEFMVSATFLWGTVSFLVGITSISTLAEMFGKWVCEVNMVMVTLGTGKSNRSIEPQNWNLKKLPFLVISIRILIGACSLCTGGTGIALMRLIYIKHQKILDYFGEYKTAIFIQLGSQSIAVFQVGVFTAFLSAFAIFVENLKFFQTYLWYMSPQPINSVVNFCLGRADEQQHIYFDYKMGMNNDTFNSVVDGPKVVLVICLIAVTSGKLFI